MNKRSEIVIVDDEINVCRLLESALQSVADVSITTDPQQALQLCKNKNVQLILSDINMPQMSGLELLQLVEAIRPDIKQVLMTGYDINNYLTQALRYNISNIFTKTAPFNLLELQSLIRGLITEDIFGIDRYLLPDGSTLHSYEVNSSRKGVEVREQISSYFTQAYGDAAEMNLLLDEIITNAIYHAPRKETGEEKYPAFTNVELEKDEIVYVVSASDSEKFGISVNDYSGNLTKKIVLEKILRHVTGQGLLDESGRGIHLCRLFADRMIINIKKGERTEVVLFNYFKGRYKGNKPLYINEI